MQAIMLLICKYSFGKDIPMAKQSTAPARRSPCPIACALDTLGDKWTLLVVRDLFLGRKRFKDFTASPEKIPTNILSDRLERLVQRGMVRQIPLEESPGRQGYALTEKGMALQKVIKALLQWGLEWEPGTVVGMRERKA
jgi:DNA-binding HxlR family transcriptional regulator